MKRQRIRLIERIVYLGIGFLTIRNISHIGLRFKKLALKDLERIKEEYGKD